MAQQALNNSVHTVELGCREWIELVVVEQGSDGDQWWYRRTIKRKECGSSISILFRFPAIFLPSAAGDFEESEHDRHDDFQLVTLAAIRRQQQQQTLIVSFSLQIASQEQNCTLLQTGDARQPNPNLGFSVC